MESESYTISIQNSNHHDPIKFQTILIEIPFHHWIAPGLNHFPVIIMLVCRLNLFLKSDKHNSFAYLLSYFYVKNFVILSVQTIAR